MNSVRELSRFGTGKRCTIIGGGHSTKELTLDDVANSFVISCNLHGITVCDMVILHDVEIAMVLAKMKPLPEYVVINRALGEHWCKYATHTFLASDAENDDRAEIMFGDTGYHALQIADKIMCFDETVLFGLDYKTKGESYHHNEEKSDKNKLNKFLKHSVGEVLPKVLRYQPLGKVYTASNNGVLNFPILPRLTTRSQNH